mmetsp:Transcript_7020/g.8124  ORF Transcript_7020/g.8124 Transcript_7020/m.8124 type:complete len:283 (-) Transcript_7020:1724-2572(-)
MFQSSAEGSSFFPYKLLEMLQNDKEPHIISWMPDGNAFAIHDKRRFASEVLPLYFKGSIQFSSFTRRMNRWKFTLTRESTKSRSVYHHPLFKRNEMQKCSEMQPKPQVKKASSMVKKARKNANHTDEYKATCSIAPVLSGGGMGQYEMSYPSRQEPPRPPLQSYYSDSRFWTSPVLKLSEHKEHDKMTERAAGYDRCQCNRHQYEDLFPQSIQLGQYSRSPMMMPGQQEMHLHNLQTDPVYQDLYNSSLREIHSIHQAQLAVQVELSHLALMSSTIATPEGI